MLISELYEGTEEFLPENVIAFAVGQAFAAVFDHLEVQKNAAPEDEKIQYSGSNQNGDRIGSTQLIFQYGREFELKELQKLFKKELSKKRLKLATQFNAFTWTDDQGRDDNNGIIATIWGRNLVDDKKLSAFKKGLGKYASKLQKQY